METRERRRKKMSKKSKNTKREQITEREQEREIDEARKLGNSRINNVTRKKLHENYYACSIGQVDGPPRSHSSR